MTPIQEQQRKYEILRILVNEYVDTAEPVGSELLCTKYRLSWSPATVRNELSELESDGYIAKPHVSGGRVPTEQAYRRIRDDLLDESEELRERWNPFAQTKVPRAVLGTSPHRQHMASHLLADLTEHLVLSGVLKSGELIEVGLPALVREPEFADQEVMANVATFMERMVDEMDQMVGSVLQDTIGVYIGEENVFPEIKSCSLLITGFELPKGERGFVGILGPTRMRYDRNIAFLEHIAEALGKRI